MNHADIPLYPVAMLGMLFIAAPAAWAQSIEVGPYLQTATEDGVWVMWESSSGEDGAVEYGPTPSLGTSVTGLVQTGSGSSRIHEVQLDGLVPATEYYYRVRTGGASSDVHRFMTPPTAAAGEPLRLVAMSDMQRDNGNPDKFREIVEDGVIDYIATTHSADIPAELDFVLVPGDLVDNGWSYSQWADDFFEPSAALMAQVPLYPVYGNHEASTPYFTQYFHLPENGTPGYEEHWWFFDQGNLRVIGLDSNGLFQVEAQLDWLDATLAEACVDPGIDFVFAQLHHPYLSELWLDGETGYTGDVIGRLESFTSDCDKPSIHFFGHTHGYSRGQSRDHEHLWVNVASAGGNLDYWGEYAQADYDEFTVTQAEYGFVVIEVEAGTDPLFRLTRVSRGDEFTPLANVVRDEIVVRRDGMAPDIPDTVWPFGSGVSPDCVVLQGSAYAEGDGDAHGATHWQLDRSCTFSVPVVDRWRQHENWYGGVDTRAGDDLTDEEVIGLEPESEYCWRVRYRDRSLSWSDWSEPQLFETGPSKRSDNLVVNGGAEDGTTGWDVREGALEALAAGECNGVDPYEGDHYFAVGGLCDEHPFGEAAQAVDISAWASSTDAGLVGVVWSAMLRDWSGADRPEITLDMLDAKGASLGRTEPVGSQTGSWTEVSERVAVLPGTRTIEVILSGTRMEGMDNDSYVDSVSLQIEEGNGSCDEGSGRVDTADTAGGDTGHSGGTDTASPDTPPEYEDTAGDSGPGAASPTVEDSGKASGCGCDHTSPAGAWVVGLLALVLRRRRPGSSAPGLRVVR